MSPGHAARLLEQQIPTEAAGEDFRGWEWHYLWNQVRSDAAFELGSHDSLIQSVTISPNGKLAASSDFAGGVSVWNLEGRHKLTSFREPVVVTQVLFLSDTVLLTAGGNGTVGFYDVRKAGYVRSVDLLLPVRAVALSRDRSQMAAQCGTDTVPAVTRIWKLRPATPAQPVARLDLTHAIESPRSGWWSRTGGALAFSPSGKELAVGDVDNLVRVYSSVSGESELALGPAIARGAITALEFSPDGRWLASQATGGLISEEVLVWNTATGEEVSVLPGHGRGVREVAFSLDGQRLAALSPDGIRLWDIQSNWLVWSPPSNRPGCAAKTGRFLAGLHPLPI